MVRVPDAGVVHLREARSVPVDSMALQGRMPAVRVFDEPAICSCMHQYNGPF
jgi:hypothetical protein